MTMMAGRGRLRRTEHFWLVVSQLLLVGSMTATIASCFSAPVFRGEVSDHFDGDRFFNPGFDDEQHGLGDMLRWQLTRDQGPWREWTEARPGSPPPQRVGPGQLRVTFVNHSTFLIQLDGLNVLTDPIWSERASPVSWAGPRRVRPPGLRFEDLPPIDVVLISHNHYDHLDLPTLERLAEAHGDVQVVTGLGNALLLREEVPALAVDELDWWESTELEPHDVVVHAVPARHFSGRGLSDRNRTLWLGFVIEGPSGSVYFAGDTGFGPHFEQIRQRLGPPRLALLPVGAYRPRWFMAPMHVDPEEAVRAHQLLEAQVSVAMHHGTFKLADDGQDQPLQELHEALQKLEVPSDSFWTLDFGAGRPVPGRATAPETSSTTDGGRAGGPP